LLHCRHHSSRKALARHGGLDDMGMIPSRLFQDINIVVNEDAALIPFFFCLFMLKIPPVRIDKPKSGLFFDIGFQQNKKNLKKFKVFISGQAGDTFISLY
jgi:hypothetical protein